MTVGLMRPEVVVEITELAGDELRHAQIIADRNIQLGGQPILEPKEWYQRSGCGYLVSTDLDKRVLLDQNIEGKRCAAIKTYAKLLDFVQGKDLVTEGMVKKS